MMNEVNKMTFQVDDLVVKTYGKKPMVVTRVVPKHRPSYTQYYHCEYIHSKQKMQLSEYKIKPYEGEIEGNEKVGKMTQKLYQVKGQDKFGVALAQNSEGKIVLEMKGTGELQAYDPSEIEVVMPYTFSVRFNNGNEQHYRGKPDTLKVGELVLETSNKSFSVGVVTGIDTKNERAKAKFNGVKIMTQEI
jgi:hypothetical protein